MDVFKKYSIIIVIPTLGVGGAERQVRYLIKYLNQHGNRPYLVSRSAENISDVQAEHVLIPDVGGVSIKALITIRKIHQAIGDNVVIISFLRQANVLVGILRLFIKFHWLSSERSNPYLEGGLYVFIEKILKRKSYVIANSLEAIRFYRERGYKTDLLPNLIEHSSNSYSKQSAKYVVLCRLIRDKRVDFILDAWACAGLDSELIIIGTGPRLDILQLKARNMNLENVRFTGHLKSPQRELQSSTFYLSASKREGMPNAALEAVESSNILILNDIPSHRDIINETPHLLYRTESLDSLVEVLKNSRRLSEIEKHRILSFNSKILANHRPAIVFEKFQRILNNVINDNQSM